MILIPLICGIFYRCGGTDQWKWCPINQKIWRWLGIGLFIGLSYAIMRRSLSPLFSIVAYAIAIQIGQYGEKSWLNFLGEYLKFFVAGFVLGLCSFVLLPLMFALSQAVFSGISFVVIKWLDDKNIVKNPWVELLRGFCGTVFLIWA